MKLLVSSQHFFLSALLTATVGLAQTLPNRHAQNSGAKTLSPSGVPRMSTSNVAHIPSAVAHSNMLARTGGFLSVAASGPAVLFVNAQTRVSAADLRDIPDQIQKFLRLPCVWRNAQTSEPVAEALRVLADTNTAAVVMIADAPGYPALLVAPESRWSLVNVAALGGSDVSAAQLGDRLRKETWRGFGCVMGAPYSNFEQCLLRPVFSPTDLDALKGKILSPEPFGKVMAYAHLLGIKPLRMASYRTAVAEGWAPAPTNDVQRSIWLELKKTP